MLFLSIFSLDLTIKIFLDLQEKLEYCKKAELTNKLPDVVPLIMKLDEESQKVNFPENMQVDVKAMLMCAAKGENATLPKILFGGGLFGFEMKEMYARPGKYSKLDPRFTWHGP